MKRTEEVRFWILDWKMAEEEILDGGWWMVDGGCWMVDGGWWMVDGGWSAFDVVDGAEIGSGHA